MLPCLTVTPFYISNSSQTCLKKHDERKAGKSKQKNCPENEMKLAWLLLLALYDANSRRPERKIKSKKQRARVICFIGNFACRNFYIFVCDFDFLTLLSKRSKNVSDRDGSDTKINSPKNNQKASTYGVSSAFFALAFIAWKKLGFFPSLSGRPHNWKEPRTELDENSTETK